jgi:hypothetical protein
MKKAGIAILFLVAIAIAVVLGVSAYEKGCCSSQSRAEREHGITLPSSTRDIQCRGDAWVGVMDRGASTMCQMASSDLPSFLSPLTITFRCGPTKSGPGDPCVNGWNVWPDSSPTAVPGNEEYGGFTKTWQGAAMPIEMLSCQSPVGDSLHVEVWSVETTSLVIKLYTDWN